MDIKKNNSQKLIKTTYENFPLWSSFYLKNLMPDLSSIYYFCRKVDDISDLNKDSAIKELLNLEKSLLNCFKKKCNENDEFFNLMQTISKFELTIDDFQSLIQANYQDLQIKRYNSIDDLLEYCKLSANPVGSLVLKIFGDFNESNLKFSNYICTGLQLINFIQDMRRDSKLGRIYIPLDDLKKFQIDENDILENKSTLAMRQLVKMQCERSYEIINSGKPLVESLYGPKKIPISLFIQSGNLVLSKIKKINYETVLIRPRVSRIEKSMLVTKTLFKYLFYKNFI
tara:strand:- start:3816 stop:4670 length:855 start_codon:yes stop_codon:yes gene_type:complete